MREFTIHDSEWAKELEKEYEQYMANCWTCVDGDWDDDAPEFETLSGEPFCGCETCQTRETLFFFTPRLLRAAAEGKVTLEE